MEPDAAATPKSLSPRAARITLLALLGGVLCLLAIIFAPFLRPLLAGGLMAIVFNPLHRGIRWRVSNKTLAAALSTIVLVIAFLTPLAILVMLAGEQMRQAYNAVRSAATDGSVQRFWSALETPLGTIGGWFGMTGADLMGMLSARIGQVAGAAVSGVVGLIGSAPSGLLNLAVALVAFFFLLRDGDDIRRALIAWCPLGKERTSALMDLVQQTIMASFYGMVAVGAVQGALCGIGVWIAGLPAPLLWGVAAAFASVLPMVGSALVWVPAAIVLLIEGSWGWGLFVIGWGVIVVANSDNVVRPWVVGAQLPVSGLALFVAMLGGVATFGLTGLLLGPVALTLAISLFRFAREEFGVYGE